MLEILEKFVKILNKLENYHVLSDGKDCVIVGTKIIIKERKEFLGNVFQHYSADIDKELPIFFLVIFGANTNTGEMSKFFQKNNLPINSIIIDKRKTLSAEGVKEMLDNFVTKKFKH